VVISASAKAQLSPRRKQQVVFSSGKSVLFPVFPCDAQICPSACCRQAVGTEGALLEGRSGRLAQSQPVFPHLGVEITPG
jgi:hypothetical protein